MRAAWYDRTGPAEEVLVVGDLPRPDPGAGEVLVHMRASGINPADVKRRSGWGGAEFGRPEKRVFPHTDGAGVIEAAGDGVDPSMVGKRVWLWNAGGGDYYKAAGGIERGTAAEYVALPQRHVVALPDDTDFSIGACLGGPACTAHHVIFADGDVLGQTILVQGGAGAVGELAIQFAVAGGAQVIATVSSDAKAEIAKAAGARHIIDRKREDVAQRVLSLFPQGVERIVEVDFGANVQIDAAVIAPNGKIASYSSTSNREPVLPYYALQRKGVTVQFVQAYILPTRARERALEGINRMLAAGRLKPTIAATLPLAEIAAAHRLVESGQALGNVVLAI
ncbi:MAG: NADPH:quinone reductase [Hyphomicrobiales bacterium]